jgi:hypothetical protein
MFISLHKWTQNGQFKRAGVGKLNEKQFSNKINPSTWKKIKVLYSDDYFSSKFLFREVIALILCDSK